VTLRKTSLPIEQPCSANWSAMQGDGVVRFCLTCREQVHDLSAMGEEAARRFLASGGQACVRYQVDADARILFVDRAVAMLPTLAAAAALAFGSLAAGCYMGKPATFAPVTPAPGTSAPVEPEDPEDPATTPASEPVQQPATARAR
jgi:hypothetical protein